jgi:hypothetical protein
MTLARTANPVARASGRETSIEKLHKKSCTT